MPGNLDLLMSDPGTQSSPDLFEEIPKNVYRRNFAAGLVHGTFLQASTAFSHIQTVLPSFLATLTPSTVAVGLLATLYGLGSVLPQLFTAHRIEDRAYEKKYLLWIITIRWVSWAIIAGVTARYAADQPLLVLWVVLGFYVVFALAGGVGTVVYADVFAKAIPTRRRGWFAGWKQLLGFVLAIGAGAVVAWILDNQERFPYPSNYALIFALASGGLLIAFSGFAMIQEPPGSAERRTKNLREMLRASMRLANDNPNFRRLLVGNGLTAAMLSIAPFFTVAALSMGVPEATIGLYLSTQMAGAAVFNVLWGWTGDRYGNRPVIIGVAVSGLAAALAALSATVVGEGTLFLTFLLTGATMSGFRLGYPNFILEMAPEHLRATCVALQNTLLAPLVVLPLLVGFLASSVSLSWVFGAMAMLMAVAAVVTWRLLDPRNDPAGACIS